MFQWTNHLVLKVTKGCNLNCKYCYVINKDQHINEFITFDNLKSIINQVIFDFKKVNKSNIEITFHGGEPTTLDKETFIKFCEYIINIFSKNNIICNLSIQTNLINVDEDWANIFSKYKIDVGISWDGIDKSNSFRNNKNSEFYKEKVELLKKHSIGYGLLLVVTKNNIDNINESVEYAQTNFGITLNCIKVNYSEDVFTDFERESEIEITGQDFFDKYLKKSIDKYINDYTNYINVDLIIKNFIESNVFYINNYISSCGNCGFFKVCGSGSSVIEVNPDASINLCGRYSDSYPEITLDNSTYDFLNLKQYNFLVNFAIKKLNILKNLHCDTCYAQSVCTFGCMAFYYSKARNNGINKFGIRNDLICSISKLTYKYIIQNLDKIVIAYYKINNNINFEYSMNNMNKFILNAVIRNKKDIKFNINNNIISINYRS
jgi:uncharacterized protein